MVSFWGICNVFCLLAADIVSSISKWQNIFGTFQIECEKFWTFWFFTKKSWKSWKSWKNRKIFEKIWKIMKNQKFSKSPKIFAFYLESSKNVLPLRNPLGSARPTQHWPWNLRWLISSKSTKIIVNGNGFCGNDYIYIYI